jgi:hypothetical protein
MAKITTDLTSLIKDVSVTIRPLELCRLLHGDADQETINLVKAIINTKYPSLSRFNQSQKILHLFSIAGTTINESLCKEVLDVDENPFSSLRFSSNNLCRSEAAPRNLIGDRATPQETVDLLSRVASEKALKGQDLFRTINTEGSQLTDIADKLFANPANPNAPISRNPPVYNYTFHKVASDMLKPSHDKFYQEVLDHVPSLFNRYGESPVFADNFKQEVLTQIRWRNPPEDGELINYYQNFMDFRLGTIKSNYYRKRPEIQPAYDITDNPLNSKVTPFTTDLLAYNPDPVASSYNIIDDRYNLTYGILPPKTDEESEWSGIIDRYRIKLTDLTSPGLYAIADENDSQSPPALARTNQGDPRGENIFSFSVEDKLDSSISDYLASVSGPGGLGDPPEPGEIAAPVDGFYDTILSGWLRGMTPRRDFPRFVRFLFNDENRDFHYRYAFSDTTKSMMGLIANIIRDSKMLRGSVPDERLKRITCDLLLSPSDPPGQSEDGILFIEDLVERIINAEDSSLELDRAARTASALSSVSYRFYLRIIAIKIILEAMFVFTKFRPKVVFSSKLFMYYFVNYLIRETKGANEEFFYKMLRHFRNEIIFGEQVRDLPQSEAEIDGERLYDRGYLRVDPLTGREVKVITEYYISSDDEQPGESREHPGEHGFVDSDRVVLGGRNNGFFGDLFSEHVPGDELEEDCVPLGVVLANALLGRGEVDEATGLEIIGFLEYFIKEELAALIPRVEHVFSKYNRFSSGDMLELLANELGSIVTMDVPDDAAATPLGTRNLRMYRNIGTIEDLNQATVQDLLATEGITEQQVDYLEAIQNTLSSLVDWRKEPQFPPGPTPTWGERPNDARRQQFASAINAENRRKLDRAYNQYTQYISSFGLEENRVLNHQQYLNGGFILERYIKNNNNAGWVNPGGGVSSIREQAEFLRGFALDPDANNMYLDPDTNIIDFSNLRFGLRLTYVYPLKFNSEAEIMRNRAILQEDFASQDPYEYYAGVIGQYGPDAEAASKKNRAFFLRENVRYEEIPQTIEVRGSERSRFVDYEQTIEREIDQSIAEQQFTYITVPIASQEVDITSEIRYSGLINLPATLEREFRQQYEPALRQALLDSPAAKTIFDYCFPVDRFLSILTIYNAEHIRTMSGREDFLKETQDMIVRTSQIAENLTRPDWYEVDVTNERVFGDKAVKEEQLEVSKDLLPVMTVLKIIEGLVSVIPVLKVWFRGLFSLVPKTISTLLEFPNFTVAGVRLPTIGSALRPLGSIISLFGEAAEVSNPSLPKMPPYNNSPRNVLDGKRDEECDSGRDN